MLSLNVDARFPGTQKDNVEQLKKDLEKHFTDRVGDKYEITHHVITYGRPTMGQPDLHPDKNGGAFVIRSSMHFPEEDAEFVKEKFGYKS